MLLNATGSSSWLLNQSLGLHLSLEFTQLQPALFSLLDGGDQIGQFQAQLGPVAAITRQCLLQSGPPRFQCGELLVELSQFLPLFETCLLYTSPSPRD